MPNYKSPLNRAFDADTENANWVSLLSVAIVVQAVHDYQKVSKVGQMSIEGCVVTPAKLQSFFRSKWCENLLQNTDYDGDWIMERIRV